MQQCQQNIFWSQLGRTRVSNRTPQAHSSIYTGGLKMLGIRLKNRREGRLWRGKGKGKEDEILRFYVFVFIC